MKHKKTPWWRRILSALAVEPGPGKLRRSVPKTPTVKPQKAEPYVYATKSGKKFHYDPCCPSILEAFNRGDAIQMSLSAARASGRSACSKCCWDYLHE